MTSPIPEGFQRHFRTSKVTDPWEPLYSRSDENAVSFGLILADAHCNSRGFVHGGVIATLADNSMGLSYVQAIRKALGETEATVRGAVTVSLSVDYVATASVGQWLQINPRVIRAGRTLGVVDALAVSNGNIIARANATFRDAK